MGSSHAKSGSHGHSHAHSHSHSHGHGHGGGEYNQDKWEESADWYDSMPEVKESVRGYTNIVEEQEWWKPGLKVLDYGCGPGDALIMLGPEISEGVGYDLSTAMVKRAQEKVEAAGLADKVNIKKLGSGAAEDIVGQQADLVICAYVLHHVEGDEGVKAKVFQRLCDATKAGGNFMICEFAFEFSKDKIGELMADNGLKLYSTTNTKLKGKGGDSWDCVICLGSKST